MTYQKKTGTLTANSHPGSYCGQDAYNDMFVTEEKHEDILHRQRTGASAVSESESRFAQLHARQAADNYHKRERERERDGFTRSPFDTIGM